MGFAGLKDEKDRSSVILYLNPNIQKKPEENSFSLSTIDLLKVHILIMQLIPLSRD